MKEKLLTIIVIGIATWLALFIGGNILPLLGTAISAILIGFIIRHTPLYDQLDRPTIKFITSYVLKGGIVLLGFTLSVRILEQIGPVIIAVMVAVIAGSIITSILINKLVKVDSKLSLLIGIGTSICGGSAIAASGPVMDAEDEDIAVAITTMFVFSMTALLLLPLVGNLFEFTDQYYGIVAGLVVNDTPSVLATSFSWSDEAGRVGTLVKVAKTLFIIPITLGLVFLKFNRERKNAQNNVTASSGFNWAQMKSIFPTFVVLFTLAFVFASIVPLSDTVISTISSASKLIMTYALVSIGLGVHINQIKKAGIKPVIIGAACSFVVLTISVASIMIFY